MSQKILDRILEEKIVAIVRGMPEDVVQHLADAYNKGDVHCVEVTLDQTSEENRRKTYDTIRALSQMEDMCVGAGTVMTVEQVLLAAEAGAKYIISPNINPNVIQKTKSLGLVSIPGAMTPSEIAYAYELGADIVKLFPNACLGLEYIKKIKAPLKHIPIMATGGITPQNVAAFMNAGCVAVGVGGGLVDKKAIAEGNYEKIQKAAKEYTDILKSI